MAEVSFGVRVPNSGPLTSVANITRAATEAEQMGFDSIFLHDHVVWSTEMHQHHISSVAKEALSSTISLRTSSNRSPPSVISLPRPRECESVSPV